MSDCDDFIKSATIACLAEILDKGDNDADLALQVCQAMMQPERRRLIMLAARCHEDNLKRISAAAVACGAVHAECDAVCSAARSTLPCEDLRRLMHDAAPEPDAQ